jgi:hypothetical protein
MDTMKRLLEFKRTSDNCKLACDMNTAHFRKDAKQNQNREFPAARLDMVMIQ